jgi:hypothetical protein
VDNDDDDHPLLDRFLVDHNHDDDDHDHDHPLLLRSNSNYELEEARSSSASSSDLQSSVQRGRHLLLDLVLGGLEERRADLDGALSTDLSDQQQQQQQHQTFDHQDHPFHQHQHQDQPFLGQDERTHSLDQWGIFGFPINDSPALPKPASSSSSFDNSPLLASSSSSSFVSPSAETRADPAAQLDLLRFGLTDTDLHPHQLVFPEQLALFEDEFLGHDPHHLYLS